MDYHSVLKEVESWPIGDRVRLARDVWDRLANLGGYEPELTDEMRAELDRRVEELDRNPGAGVPWEEVKARVLRRLQT